MSFTNNIRSNLPQIQNQRFEALSVQSEENMILGLSPEKVKHLAKLVAATFLMFSSIYTVVAPALEFTATVFPFPITVILFVVGAAIFSVSTQFYDYNNPEQVEVYRLEAQEYHLNLKRLEEQGEDVTRDAKKIIHRFAKEHSFDKMFYYAIPKPMDFIEVYNFAKKHMTLNEEIEFFELISSKYEEAKQKHGNDITSFIIPPPVESRQKFLQETRNMGIKKLLKTYDIEKIHSLGILSESQYQGILSAKQKSQVIEQWLVTEGGTSQTQYVSLKRPLKNQYENAVKEVKNIYENEPVHDELQKLRDNQCSEITVLRRRMDEEIAVHQKVLDEYFVAAIDHGNINFEHLDPSIALILENKGEELSRKSQQIQDTYGPFFAEIGQKYTFLRGEHTRQLNEAKERMRHGIEAAKQTYTNELEPLKQRRNELVGAETLNEYKAKYIQLNDSVNLGNNQ